MRWFRRWRRSAARVAVFALLLQLALCFDHFHAGNANEASATQQALTLPTDQSAGSQQRGTNDPADDPDRYCAFCAAVNLLSTAQLVTPPSLPLPAEFAAAETSNSTVSI